MRKLLIAALIVSAFNSRAEIENGHFRLASAKGAEAGLCDPRVTFESSVKDGIRHMTLIGQNQIVFETTESRAKVHVANLKNDWSIGFVRETARVWKRGGTDDTMAALLIFGVIPVLANDGEQIRISRDGKRLIYRKYFTYYGLGFRTKCAYARID